MFSYILYISKLVSQGTEQEPTLAYLSNAFDGLIMQASPLFIPAAIRAER